MIDVIANEGSDNRLFTVGDVNQLSEWNVGVVILNLEHPGSGLEPHYLYRRPHPHDNGILTENARFFSDVGVVATADGFCVVQNIGRNDTHEIWRCNGVSSAGFVAVVDPKTGREHFLPPWKPSNLSDRTYEIFGEAPRIVKYQGLWLSDSGP